MGHRIEPFEFRTGMPDRRTIQYPLDQWMDGCFWEIVAGEDFECSPRHMQARLHHYATSRGYRVQTQQVHFEGRASVVFRFTPKRKPPR